LDLALAIKTVAQFTPEHQEIAAVGLQKKWKELGFDL
jgi:hypothetical protein